MHSYPRKQKQIPPLPQDQWNQLVPLCQIPVSFPQYKQFTLVKSGAFYPYNYKCDDFGWGCAWRAIQTMLSAYGIDTDFSEFVPKYRGKDLLMSILQNQYKERTDILRSLGWAPEENENCWAEPFIGKIICMDYEIQSKLKLVNGYPKAYAPQFVFSQTITFPDFWLLIKKYIPESPIMIDDSQLALSIIGYREGQHNQKHLLLADPHITTNRTAGSRKTGIYEVVLDEAGQQVTNDVTEEETNLYPFNSFQKIQFCDKKWMILAPEPTKL